MDRYGCRRRMYDVLAALVAIALALATPPPHCLASPPRMSDAAWARRAAERAGFRVHGCSEISWLVKGRGRTSFGLWNTRRGREGPLVARVAGVPVRGFLDHRVNWRARGLTVWIEYGPRRDSILPRGAALARLVRATLRLPRR